MGSGNSCHVSDAEAPCQHPRPTHPHPRFNLAPAQDLRCIHSEPVNPVMASVVQTRHGTRSKCGKLPKGQKWDKGDLTQITKISTKTDVLGWPPVSCRWFLRELAGRGA
jgi:hypothetical protein